MEHLFSSRAKTAKASEIREILKLTMKPDIISFAGGLPAPELFPIKEMLEVSVEVMQHMGQEALQYSTTEGYNPLRKHIARLMKTDGIGVTYEDILITNGSQQGLDFTGKIFLNPGDYVVCESPSYLGAINAFRAYECQFIEVDTDEHGMNLFQLEQALQTDQVKFIYVIPDFQNPSGKTWSAERRKGLYELAQKYDKVIVEDNPYGALRFEGEPILPIKALDVDGRVIYLGTFSKTFSPGLRIGWTCASPNILNKYILMKQSSDLQSSSISQRELSVFLEHYDFDAHIEKIKTVYRNRRDLMLEMMRIYFPSNVAFVVPQGGLFTWVTLPEHINTKELLEKAIEQNVAFVPGGSFFPNGGKEHYMRLNYSNMTEEKIKEGIQRLGTLLNTLL